MTGRRSSWGEYRYKIVRLLEPQTVINRAVTLDHAIYLSREVSKKQPGRHIAVVDTEEPTSTRIVSLDGKTWWAQRCDLHRAVVGQAQQPVRHLLRLGSCRG